jgi:membrane carboxypeptidase/penicillin-binding protein PbpC
MLTKCAAFSLLACALILLASWLALPLVPLPCALFADHAPGLEFLDRTGKPLRVVRPDGSPFHRPVEYGEIPQPLIQATLAAEDRRFWRHPGVDWRATAWAAWQWVRHRRVVSGGSTITQQLIKLAEPRPRNLRTKLVEAVQALRLEQVWDKQRILAAYLDRLDYGNFNRGCAAAADFYFAKPLRDLSPAECALLAALPQAPSRLNPHTHFERAVKRQQWVLGQMNRAGWLTDAQFQRALRERLNLAAARRTFEAPHFVDLLLSAERRPFPLSMNLPSPGLQPPSPRDAGRGQGEGSVLAGSWSVSRASAPRELSMNQENIQQPTSDSQHPMPAQTEAVGCSISDVGCWMFSSGSAWRALPSPTLRTTLDLPLTRFAETALRQHLSRLKAQHVSDGAVVVLDNQSGDVLAMVGSGNYFAPAAGQVNGAWAPRSPGSTLKPFTYLLALERGATPATIVADVPTEFVTATGLFAPVNYDRHCYGPMRYRLALANSLNISAVKVLASLGGPGPLQQLLQRCGLSTLSRPAEHYGLGLTIGNAEARLLELANAYACLARLGQYKPYRLVLDAPGERGLAIHDSRCSTGRRVADPAAAYLIADILSDNDARASAFGAESPLRFSFPVACKTGTSSDFRDNWAFGYTPEFTVGVWVGNFDSSPMQHVSGVTGAAPLLHELVEHLHQHYGTTWYSAPTNVVECWVHPVTGKRLDQAGTWPRPDAVREKFLASNLPPFETPADYGLRPSPLDPQTSDLGLRTSDFGLRRAVQLGGEYRDWLASADNWLGNRAVLAYAPGSLRILFPPPGTILYLDPDLPQQGRRIRLRAEGSENLQWQSDSVSVVREDNRQIALLTEGRHQLTVREPLTGAEAQTWLEVLTR